MYERKPEGENISELPQRMALESMDVAEEKRQQLKQLFPEVFNEDKVDFEQLQRVLGESIDTGKERYGLTWPGKADCMKVIQEPSRATLKPCRDESVNFDNTENLFIEGDNLEVLKLLQKSYFGKVKMIYIDPPYNTGKEFIYPDNYQETIETYMAYAGLVDDKGKKFSTNATTEGRFHSKWLNMMYPRLYLAKNLLREDGVIFISIDDNEVENLQRMCDEIFGEENLLARCIWKNKTGGGARTKGWIGLHEYILCYAKNSNAIEDITVTYSEKTASMYNKKDEHYSVRGPYATWPLDTTSMADRPNLRFPILHKGKEIWPAKQWLWSRERVINAQKNNMLEFNEQSNGSYKVRFKGYLKDENGKIRRGKPLSVFDGPYTQEGSKNFQEFIDKDVFPFPKPTRLISSLLDVSTSESSSIENEIILDFFSGSATTAQAVMEQNQSSKSRRKFILVQLPELCDKDTAAYKKGFKRISDIGKERIRRASVKIAKEANKADHLDLGFRVYKLNKSHFSQWQSEVEPGNVEQLQANLELHSNHISEEVDQEALLYELLLKSGYKLTESIIKKEFAGQTAFSIANDALLICLEDHFRLETLEAILLKDPSRIIVKDSAFNGNDQLKVNAVQTVEAHNRKNNRSTTKKDSDSEYQTVFLVV